MHKNTRFVAVASVNKPHQLAALQSVDRWPLLPPIVYFRT